MWDDGKNTASYLRHGRCNGGEEKYDANNNQLKINFKKRAFHDPFNLINSSVKSLLEK